MSYEWPDLEEIRSSSPKDSLKIVDDDSSEFDVIYDMPEYSISFNRKGRFKFTSKTDSTFLFENMKMPLERFWSALSTVIISLNNSLNKANSELIMERIESSELRKLVESRKLVFVDSNKKKAFFAGMNAAKMLKGSK